MTDPELKLASEFPPATVDDWRALAEAALNGGSFDKRLVTTAADGFRINPLYTRDDLDDHTRAIHRVMIAAGNRRAPAAHEKVGWDIRQRHAHPDPKTTNAAILQDLEAGATSVRLVLDESARNGGDAAHARAGVDGVMLYGLADVELALKGVFLNLATVSVDAGAAAIPAAALLSAATGNEAADARLSFDYDPIGVLVSTGKLPTSVDRTLAQLGEFARDVAAVHPQATAVGVNGSHWFNAGATDATELAASLATALTYLRAMTAAGLSTTDAARTLGFTVAVGTDFFGGIAKLRALRLMWHRILEASGTPEARVVINAVAAEQVLSRVDPCVNLLRTTVTSFAAGLGGADSVTCLPFDHCLGLPDDFSRRIARNTQLVLEEESNVHRVLDPAGGSWYVENHTRVLAEKAWARFQSIEREGGIVGKILDGSLAQDVETMWQARRTRLATRLDPLTGVSEFPDIDEPPVTPEGPDLTALRQQAGARMTETKEPVGSRFAELVSAAKSGANIGQLFAALYDDPENGATASALQPHRLAEDFEALRGRAAAHTTTTGNQPSIFLANIGRVAEHTARATFARNFFEAGGVKAVTNDGFARGADAARAFAASGARLAVICGSDGQYGELAIDFASALRQQDATRIYLAGRPGDARAAYLAAGIDDFVFVGANVLAVCAAVLDHLEVK